MLHICLVMLCGSSLYTAIYGLVEYARTLLHHHICLVYLWGVSSPGLHVIELYLQATHQGLSQSSRQPS